MATTRKRPTSGFASTGEVVSDPSINEEATVIIEDLVETAEANETYSVPEIIPTEDSGPRFVEVKAPEPVATKLVAPQNTTPILQPPPKRHPRNIPKFSSHK